MFKSAPRIRLLIIGFMSVFLTGCIEIVEEITINKDKSGSISYSIESPQAQGLFTGLLSMIDPTVEDNVIREAKKLIRELEAREGITNIRYNLSGQAGSYYLTFDFSEPGDVNAAIYAIGGARKTIFSPNYIKAGRSKLRKFNFTPWLQRYIKREEMELPTGWLAENIYYKSVIRTPEHISNVRNCIVKDDRMAVQRNRIDDILGGRANTGLTVRY